MTALTQAAIFLAAAVIAVPISKRLGLGSVLGYLVAGMMLGPNILNLVGDVDSILHFAEFGVVLLLFIIGLELQPSRLWLLRKPVFGLGSAQVIATTALLTGVGILAGLPWTTAWIAAAGVSLSSTAFALQILGERHELTTHHGRASFAILLFQDLAVIPLLALLPLMPGAAGATDGGSMFNGLRVVGVVAGVVIGGRYLLRPVLRIIASTHIHELFTAMTLLVVIATALAMQFAGLSMALGAFLAGVLLADSEYRHELEADIEPFKGLLLGLFFITVGASVNLHLIVAQPFLVMAMVLGLVTAKFIIVYALGRATGMADNSSRHLAIVLSQGGEFAFVLFNAATAATLMPRALTDQLILAVTLSMAVTPLLIAVQDWLARRLQVAAGQSSDYDAMPTDTPRVIIAGFGRFGQIVARILRARKIRFTALDSSAQHVDFVRRFGNKVYYGDPTRLDLLRAARAGDAEAFVIAVDDADACLKIAQTVRRHFPDLPIYARARNRQHVYKLMDLGIQAITRETFFSSLDLAGKLLRGLGHSDADSSRTIERFRDYDEQLLERNYAIHDDEAKLADLAKRAAQELEDLFEQDARQDAAA